MSEFDFAAAIRELAEANRECGPEHGKGDYGLPPPEWCSRCNGMGRIVPFALLRVECRAYLHDRPNPIDADASNVCIDTYHNSMPSCLGHGWVPEQDVKKACWRIIEVLVKRDYQVSVYANSLGYRTDISDGVNITTGWSDGFGYDATPSEAVIRAAWAWAKADTSRDDSEGVISKRRIHDEA